MPNLRGSHTLSWAEIAQQCSILLRRVVRTRLMGQCPCTTTVTPVGAHGTHTPTTSYEDVQRAPPSTMTVQKSSVTMAAPVRWFSVALTSTLNRCCGFAKLPTCTRIMWTVRQPALQVDTCDTGSPGATRLISVETMAPRATGSSLCRATASLRAEHPSAHNHRSCYQRYSSLSMAA